MPDCDLAVFGIRKSVHEQHLAHYEMKYLGSPPGTELAVPRGDLSCLLQYERVGHR